MVVIVEAQALLHQEDVSAGVYQDLTDLVAGQFKILYGIGTWQHHIQRCLEKYPIEFFKDKNNCLLWFLGYQLFYNKVQQLAIGETGVEFI